MLSSVFTVKYAYSHGGVNDSVVGLSPWVVALLRANFLNVSYLIYLVLKIGYVWFSERADILCLSVSWRRTNP